MGSPSIAFIQACWHRDLVDVCWDHFSTTIADARSDITIDRHEVPGAFEIPLHAKLLARTGRYAAIVAAGLVVDGGIYRHEFVADAVISGLMQVGLESEVPVLSSVLTPHHFHEHSDHQDFFRSHLATKGVEVASATLATLDNIAALTADSSSAG